MRCVSSYAILNWSSKLSAIMLALGLGAGCVNTQMDWTQDGSISTEESVVDSANENANSESSVPAAPTNVVAAQDLGSNTITFNWVHSGTNVADFIVERRVDAGAWEADSTPRSSTTRTATDHDPSQVGSTYEYRVKARNAAGEESPYGTSAGVILRSKPAVVTGVATESVSTTSLKVSWPNNGDSNITGFKVLGYNTNTASFSTVVATASADESEKVISGLTFKQSYSYKVVAINEVFESDPSAAVSGEPRLNLVVPIEMFDAPVTSPTSGPAPLARTRTYLNPADYTGSVVTYYLEYVASNTNTSADYNVWVYENGSLGATHSVPRGTMTPRRFVHTFSPSTGNAAGNYYELKVQNTAVAGQLTIYSARILVQQTGAIKTKVYIPLSSVSSDSMGGAIDTGTSVAASYVRATTLSNLPGFPVWKKDSGAYNLSTDTSASNWTFDVTLLGDSTAGTTYASLFNREANSNVSASQVSYPLAANEVKRVTAAIPNNAAGFADSSDNTGAGYEVRAKSSVTGVDAIILKAGIWVTIDDVSKAQVVYRVGKKIAYTTGTNPGYANDQTSRTQMSLANFSNPKVYFEVSGKIGAAGVTGKAQLHASSSDIGPNDASTSLVDLPFPTVLTLERTRSSEISMGGLGSADKFFTRIQTGGGTPGTVTSHGAFMIIDASP